MPQRGGRSRRGQADRLRVHGVEIQLALVRDARRVCDDGLLIADDVDRRRPASLAVRPAVEPCREQHERGAQEEL